MSSTELAQGTHEWRQARVGKVTGSRIGAILGVSPFTTRKKVMREMVDEMLGNIHDISNPAMDWGNEHEDEAAKMYEFLYAGASGVHKTGFWEQGDLGASPDRLVGEDGLLEIKCPYGIREDKAPKFKSIDDMPHYWHQIQLQLWVTGRKWCHFFQWTPEDSDCQLVEFDPEWYAKVEDEVVVFLGELRDLFKKAREGGSEERVGLSARWAAAAERYKLASAEKARVEAELSEAKAELQSMMEDNEIDQCVGAGLKVQKVMRKGSIDYKLLAMEQLTEDVVKPIEEDYRRKGSVSWRIDEETDT